jgi:hypothetical protein
LRLPEKKAQATRDMLITSAVSCGLQELVAEVVGDD